MGGIRVSAVTEKESHEVRNIMRAEQIRELERLARILRDTMRQVHLVTERMDKLRKDLKIGVGDGP